MKIWDFHNHREYDFKWFHLRIEIASWLGLAMCDEVECDYWTSSRKALKKHKLSNCQIREKDYWDK